MIFTLLCERCHGGWSVSTPLEFARLTDTHRQECPGPDLLRPFPEPQDVA